MGRSARAMVNRAKIIAIVMVSFFILVVSCKKSVRPQLGVSRKKCCAPSIMPTLRPQRLPNQALDHRQSPPLSVALHKDEHSATNRYASALGPQSYRKLVVRCE